MKTLVVQPVAHVGDDYISASQKCQFQNQSRIAVQQSMPPVIGDELTDYYSNRSFRILGVQFVQIAHNRFWSGTYMAMEV